jgi:VanZ family protein
VAGYFLLGALLARALAGGEWSGYSWWKASAAWALSAAYGVTDEWHQSFVPGRTPDVGDWLADAVGAAAGVIVATGVARARVARRRAV